jgi:acyl-CoA thioester hydrolase
MTDDALTYRGTVYPWQCDHMGHMNVMWYVGKFDEASWQWFASIGLTPARLRQDGRGMAAVEQQIAYRRELRAGDTVSIRTRVLEVRARSLRFSHAMHDDTSGELCATSVLTAVHLDTTARRAVEIDPAIRARAGARPG